MYVLGFGKDEQQGAMYCARNIGDVGCRTVLRIDYLSLWAGESKESIQGTASIEASSDAGAVLAVDQ